ncbi:protein-glutamate O-methyltransferase CheR [Geminocystis sp. NIES-3709]|uniref:CheR family methyltransferase n=1 Tax=Geminocystis sp. NIES-3709 TaxID=1617448 RepID=UPI0005FCD356|nr:protein-glutamate O-methyltransferase CheR [Geminocystis sp. NIES-3709]BAQ66042.1 chemotaxis protein methyltransferase CheR [Geminocystis sp. NIES-3709]
MITETISSSLREEFVELIAKQTGIEIRSQNYGSMGDNILSRVQELKLSSPQTYYNLLLNSEGEEEWQKFVCLTTNKESYFFRDKGQFSLLRNTLLPELIRRNQRTKSLRICSAGCSTGQEPYSIAILLKELIPDLASWNVVILGIDINRESLAQGKKAVYNTWSFRQVEEDIKTRYFKNSAGYYQLNDEIRQLVKFHQINLARDIMPRLDSDLHDMDLIICRNVFIYFTESAIAHVIEKFFNTLKPNGYLMTGHAELTNNHVKAFQAKLFTESVVYQRRSGEFAHAQPSSSQSFKPTSFDLGVITTQQKQNKIVSTSIKPITPSRSKNIIKSTIIEEVKQKSSNKDEILLTEVKQLFKTKSYHLAQKKLEQILQEFPKNFQGTYLMAELQANLGEYELAKKWCNKAIELNSFNPNPYHILANIAEEQGNLEGAKKALKQVIYLEPNAVSAYVNLANLYQLEGDLKRANKMQQSALKILQTLPTNTSILELGNISAQDLTIQLQQSLSG